jgi:hypothetical protein
MPGCLISRLRIFPLPERMAVMIEHSAVLAGGRDSRYTAVTPVDLREPLHRLRGLKSLRDEATSAAHGRAARRIVDLQSSPRLRQPNDRNIVCDVIDDGEIEAIMTIGHGVDSERTALA